VLGGVFFGIRVSQNNRGDFRLPGKRDAHDPWSMRLEQNRGSIAIVQPSARNRDSEAESEPEDFAPNMLAFAHSYSSELLVLILPSKRSFDDWSNSP